MNTHLNENGVLFFSETDDNGKTLSFCSVKPTEFEWEIYDIETIPEARNRGLAKKILAEVIDYAQKNGAEKIFLEVRESNEIAINLYKKSGFEEYLVRKNYYSNPNENAVCMVLNLPSRTR